MPEIPRRGYRVYCIECEFYWTRYLGKPSPSSDLTPEARATLAEARQVLERHINESHGGQIQNGANFGGIGVAPL